MVERSVWVTVLRVVSLPGLPPLRRPAAAAAAAGVVMGPTLNSNENESVSAVLKLYRNEVPMVPGELWVPTNRAPMFLLVWTNRMPGSLLVTTYRIASPCLGPLCLCAFAADTEVCCFPSVDDVPSTAHHAHPSHIHPSPVSLHGRLPIDYDQ